jgi:hypothetical protein
MGLPGQHPEDVDKTLDFIDGYGAKINMEEYSPVPGSEDFDLSGLNNGNDPLLHNNTYNLITHPQLGKDAQRLKDRARSLNAGNN